MTSRRRKEAISLVLWSLLLPLSATLGVATHGLCQSQAQDASPAQDRLPITFEERLQFYLNQQTRDFLERMVAREKLLLGLVQNVSAEIQARGVSGLEGFEALYGQREALIAAYSAEIDNIVGLLSELGQLEEVALRQKNSEAWETIIDLKAKLRGLIEGRELSKKGIYSSQRVLEMMREYSSEIDSLVGMYDRLEEFEKQARKVGDEAALKMAQEQKSRLFWIISRWRGPSPVSDSLAHQYADEAVKIAQVLAEIDSMEAHVAPGDLETLSALAERKRAILVGLDARLIRLLGYSPAAVGKGPTLSTMIKEWKAARLATYEAEYTQYMMLKRRLLETATPEQRLRMLDRETKTAMLSYLRADYPTAVLQLEAILQDYSPYYATLDGILFYKSEANYVQSLFEQAWEGYQQLIENYPNSEYYGESLLRLMIISQTYGWYDRFHQYWDTLKARASFENPKTMAMASYLAGFVFFHENRFPEAESALSAVPKDSRYFMPARYLLGVVYANLDRYTDAQTIFEELANQSNYPWTDRNTTLLRNNALLKLGFLHYQRGQLEQAIAYFDQVSKGYDEYDKSLLGKAWSNLKRGQYEATVSNVQELFQGYLASDYTYEALVLAAHCKRILDRPEEALRDLRYVSKARTALNQTQKYYEERQRVLEQEDELDRLEQLVLERRDRSYYPKIVAMRDQLHQLLQDLTLRGSGGSQLVEAYSDERRGILDQIDELNQMARYAQETGNRDLERKVNSLRIRLVRVLETYQADRRLNRTSSVVDYPLASKEGVALYRKAVTDNLLREMATERDRLQQNLDAARTMLARWNSTTAGGSSVELELLEDELKALKNRVDRFQTWLAENQVQDIKTNFDQWADFSGFGISDITFRRLQERDQLLTNYAQTVEAVNRLLDQQRKELEERISRLDQEAKRLEEQIRKAEMEKEKSEQEKYFRELYFDTKQREEEEKKEEPVKTEAETPPSNPERP